jgi:hypothetical protein
MLTQEENDRLTHVGAGTPMGELLRRNWHPVGTRVELDKEPVQKVRLFGEDLVLFKSARDEIGSHQPSLSTPRCVAVLRHTTGGRAALLLPWLGL